MSSDKSFLKELFEYNQESNEKWMVLFEKRTPTPSIRAVELFNHILNAHQIWNNRIEAGERLYGVWQIHEISELRTIHEKNFARTLQLLYDLDLTRLISYTNSKGAHFTNSVRDILFHVVNHSTYHRAQLATEFKQLGTTPPATDFIFYKRKD